MGGCLGPKQRKQQVYIEVIQSIHEQVQHMTFTNVQNLDIYTLIKQKLSKKGLLRKLIDNLVSHRAKIYDSLNHNYQIVLQNSHIENKYAGLLIIDQIIQGIYQSLKLLQQRMDVEGSDNFSNLTNKRTDNLKQSLQIMFGDSKSKQKKIFQMAMQANPLIREIDSRFDTIYFSLVIYLLDNVPKMYMRILKSINSYCLNKRSKFLCTQSVWQVIHFIMSRIVKFSQMKQNIFSYMLLLQNVKENFKQYQKAQDLKLFIDLWIREMTKGKHSKAFYQENQMNNNNFSSNKNNSNSNNNNNNNNNTNNISHHNNQQSQTADSKTSQQYIGNLIKIISLYFDTNISTWNSNFLYDVMLDIYDQHQFEIEKILTFQSVIFNIVMKNQLHMQFFRGLFLLLLDYLGYRHAVRGSRVQSTMSLHGEVNEIKWMNCQKKHVKYNSLKTLRRWVVNKHIDLNETVSYNCRLLFQAYLTNYSLTDLQYNTQVSKQFLKLIRQNLQIKSKKIVIITITQSIKQEDIDSRIRSICVGLLRELLGDGGVLMVGARDSINNNLMIEDDDLYREVNDITALDVIITIQEYYSKQNKLQLIQLMGFILHTLPSTYYMTQNQEQQLQLQQLQLTKTTNAVQQTFPTSLTTTNNPININFTHKLGDFLYSCYSTIIESQDDLVFMLRFVCSIVSVMREICLIKQNVSIGFVVYSEIVNKLVYYCLSVNNCSSGNNTKDSQEQRQKQSTTKTPPKKQQSIPTPINKLKFYFIYYLTCQIGHLLYDNIKVLKQQFMKINQKITKSQTITQGLMGTNKSIHHDKREQVFSLIDKLLAQPVFKDTNILKQSFKQQQIFQALKLRLEKQNYRQTQKIISSYFSNYCSRSTTNRNTNSNNQQDRDNNNNVHSDNLLNNSMSGNFGNKTGLSNAFGRRDSIFMESENSSFYRQEDKNLKDVLGIINC